MSEELELRQNSRRRLFNSVGELSDLEHQRATWLDREMQNPHYSYAEFFESFYDVAGGEYEARDRNAQDAPLNWLIEQGILSEGERDAIWPVHEALRDYVLPIGDYYDHEAILRDPAWHDVCRIAASARDELLMLVDSEERALFENELPGAAAKRWP
jgi:hypothetical protein